MPELPVENPVAAGQPLPEADIAALIEKHLPEINRITGLEPQEQMMEFQKYEVDPNSVIEHYSDLKKRSEALKVKADKGDKKISFMGWAGFLIVGAAVLFAPLKNFANSKVIKGIITAFAAITGGIGASYAGIQIFSGKVQEDSKALAIETRDALARELAIAIEAKTIRDAAAAKTTPTVTTPAPEAQTTQAPSAETMASKVGLKPPIAPMTDYKNMVADTKNTELGVS